MLETLKTIYKPKTELETVDGNGAERQKRTYIVCIWWESKCNLCFYIYI